MNGAIDIFLKMKSLCNQNTQTNSDGNSFSFCEKCKIKNFCKLKPCEFDLENINSAIKILADVRRDDE